MYRKKHRICLVLSGFRRPLGVLGCMPWKTGTTVLGIHLLFTTYNVGEMWVHEVIAVEIGHSLPCR